MTSCPPDERLLALLDETISEIDLATLDGHVIECDLCQRRLDRLSEAPDLAAWLAPTTSEPHRYPFLSPPRNAGELGRLNGYVIRSEIGRGGMGLVLRGWDEALTREVAIKILRPEDNTALAEARFSRESRAVAQLRHDHVVSLFAIDRTLDGRPFLVMPYVPGVTLRERLRDGPMSGKDAAEVMRQVADGLAAAHALGLIHRDVKPANILLDAADGRAKLTDFGLVRAATDGDTLSPEGMLAGTPVYMSPEQASTPERIDARSDVYSLGVTLYECLTGTVPFRGSPLAVIELHREQEPVAPRRLNAGVARDLETICLKALSKTPAGRYATAAAFRDDLARWLAGRPILARPAGPIKRVQRWCGRNPVAVAVIVVSIIGSLAAATGWWQAGVKADESARNAEQARHREEEATEARALADERSALALQAITTLVTKAQSLSDNVPGTLKLKQQLNEAALLDLRKLAECTAKVPGVDRSLLQAHQKLGDALHQLGQTDEALREWSLALATAEQLIARDANDTRSRREAAYAHYCLGYSQNLLLKRSEAAAHMNAAVSILEELQPKAPDDRVILHDLSVAYNGRVGVERLAGQMKAALADSERALAIDHKLVDLDPNNAQTRLALYYSHNRLADTYTLLCHDYPAAERHFSKELRLAEEQRAKTPENAVWQRAYHLALLDLSSVQQRQCDFPAAEKSARDASGWLEAAAHHDPDDVQRQREYAVALIHLGNVQLGQSKFADAEASFVQAMAIFDSIAAKTKSSDVVSLDISILCIALAGTCERQDRFAEAARWMDRLIAATRDGPADPAQRPQTLQMIARQTAIRDAYLLAQEAIADPAIIGRQEKETAIRLAAIRARALARRGQVEQAIREVRELCEKHTTNAVPAFCLATVLGQAALASTTEQDRTSRIETGIAALLEAVRIDRASIAYAHFVPELNAIRSHPSFQTQLRNSLDGQ